MFKVSVAQLVEWQSGVLKELGSSPSWCFWRCCCRIRSDVNSRLLWRTQRQAERRAAWPGTARNGTAPSPPPPPPRLYFLAGVTRGAYFYGLYYFAFLECALPGVNPRPQFGQCGLHKKTNIILKMEKILDFLLLSSSIIKQLWNLDHYLAHLLSSANRFVNKPLQYQLYSSTTSNTRNFVKKIL